jgi:methylated-DNA-[protein]-cysteine S-methyltransferase
MGVMATYATTIDSPVGPLTLVATDEAICELLWAGDESVRPSGSDAPVVDASHPVLARAAEELCEYFAGARRDFTVPVHTAGTAFQQSVWTVLRGIPYGTTITYGEQARRVGNPKAMRAVGGANGRNPVGIIVPCHRVIGADGSLTGFGGGMKAKAWLLEHERRLVAND